MNEEIKYITSFSGKLYDSSEIADIISKNLEEHADYYAEKGINRYDFINSVEMLYKGLLDKTYTDVMSGFKGPAGNILPLAVRFMKTVLLKATPVESEVEELGYYNPNIFWDTFKTVYNVKDNYDFKDWKPGGVYNQSNDHSDATLLMSSLITNKIIPTLNQYKYKEGLTLFSDVTEAENAWKAYAEALKTKKTGETGLIGNSDKALATLLGGPSLSNMLDGINGNTISYLDMYVDKLKEELRKKGFSEEESAELALFYLLQEKEKLRKPYEDKKKEDAEQLKRKLYQTDFESYVTDNWYNLKSDIYNNGTIKYNLNIDNKSLKNLAKMTFNTNYLEEVRKFIYGNKNLATLLLPLNSDSEETKESKRNMFYNAVQKILQPLTKKDYDFLSNGWIKDPENGDVWIHKNSFDVKFGSVLVYDPYQQLFYRARLVNPNNTQSDDKTLRIQPSDVILNIGKAAYKIAHPMDSSSKWDITSNKKGAKLLALRKLSIGGTADFLTDEDEDPMLAVDMGNLEYNVILQHPDNVFISNDRPWYSSDYTEEERQLYREGDSDNYWDTIRAWSTGADVAGGVASLWPGYGTIVGGALGTVGWLGNWVADALDPGVSREEMWTNVLINGALVPLSMIPGAKAWTQATKGATKAARAKGALKLAGKGVVTVGAPAYGLYNTAANGERFWELWKKYEFGDDGSLTSEEFRELCNYLSIASGSFYSVKSNALKYAHIPDLFKEKLGPKTSALLGKIMAGVGDPGNLLKSKFSLSADALQTSYRLAPKINPTIKKHYISVVDKNGVSRDDIEISQTAKGLIENLIKNYKKGRGSFQKIKDGTNNDPAYETLLKNISNIYRKDLLVLPESAKFELSNYLKNIDDIDNIETKTFTGTDGFGNTKEVTFNKEVLQKVKNIISSDDNPDLIYTKLLEVVYPETISEIDPAKLFRNPDVPGSITDDRQNRLLLDLYNTHKGFRTSKGGSIFDPLSITRVRNAFKEQIGPLDLNRLKVKDSEIDDYINFRFKDELFKDGDITKATTLELVTKIKESITSSDEEFKMLQEWILLNRDIKNLNRRNSRASNVDDTRIPDTDDTRTSGIDNETDIPVIPGADDTGTSSVIISGADDGVIPINDTRTSDVDLDNSVMPIDDTKTPVDADNITVSGSQSKPRKKAKKKAKSKKHEFGGILQELVNLRNKNFTTDITKKFSEGGIIKAQNGDNTNEWIIKYNPHGGLNQYSTSTNPYTSSVKDNQYHKNGSDLSSAIDYITKYTNNYDQITRDIQSYITDNNFTDVNDFISKYNEDITNLHNKWKSQKYTYGEYGASGINDLYKKLYKSTANQDQLGWDENLKDIFGSTTNARRVIVRNGELSSLTPEQLAKRTHTVKVNGLDVKVYVNADGTLTTTFTSNPSNTGTGNNGNGNGNGNGTGNGNETIHRPSFDEEDDKKDNEKYTEDYSYWGASYDPYLASVNKAYPDLLDLARFIDNKRNNRRVWELGLKKKFAYKSPILLKRNVYGDFGALTSALQEGNDFMSTMARMASLTNSPEDAAAIMMDALLRQNNIVNAGRKLDNAAMTQSSKESQLTEEAVYKYNKEVGDYNIGPSVAKFNHDLDSTSAYHSADTTNNNNYTMGLEKRTRENWRDTKDAIRDTSLLQLENMRKRLVLNTPVILDYNDRIAAETDPTKKLLLQQAKAREIEQNEKRWGKYFFDMLIAILLGKPLPDISTYMTQSNNSKATTNVFDQPPAMKTKNGGKLTNHKIKRSAEDLKELRKLIKFNITTNQKALDNLSKSVLLELKKMMDI